MSRVPSLSSPFLLGFDEIERALDRVVKGADGTRDIFLQSPLEATLKFQGPCGAPNNRLADLPSGRN